MTDIQAYIESGIIEEYCLGLLSTEVAAEVTNYAEQHDAIRNEIELTEATLANYAAAHRSLEAGKHTFLHNITNLTAEENLQLDKLPLITLYSDYQKWKAVITGITPNIPMDGCFGHVLTMNPSVEQYLIWLDGELVEEAHNDVQESFLILEGSCECNLGGRIVNFAAGDYFEVPLFTHHTIKNTTAGGTPIKAIVQRVLQAA
jgi:mannose-6-phosphate isomerase-like protein (cupin superfamily)